MRTPRRTSGVISTGARISTGAMPTATMRPPSRTMPTAWTNVSSRPSASNATSTPPPVSSRDLRHGITLRGVDHVGRAERLRCAELLVADVDRDDLDAPHARAIWTISDPTPPVPTTATRSPARRSAPRRERAVGGEHRAAEDRRLLERLRRRKLRTRLSAGTTAYSASPPIEYIASGEPSGAVAGGSRRRRACPRGG